MYLQTTAKEQPPISGSTCHQTASARKLDINLWWLLTGFTPVKWFRGASIKPIMRSLFNCHSAWANGEHVQMKKALLRERLAEQNSSWGPSNLILSCWPSHFPSSHVPHWLKNAALQYLVWRVFFTIAAEMLCCRRFMRFHSNGLSLDFGQCCSPSTTVTFCLVSFRGWYVCQAEAPSRY